MQQETECPLSTKAISSDVVQKNLSRRSFIINSTGAVATLALSATTRAQNAPNDSARAKFKRIPVQYIAALANPEARTGDNAQQWGLWRKDPGPRGVSLKDYEHLRDNGGVAPAQWTFNPGDWWLEEHGLIMEAPEFPMPAGQYLVTGDRDTQAVLNILPMDSEGRQFWQLDNNATVYDVTHLRCRSARYTPQTSLASCSPAEAQAADFPVNPGAVMPSVADCKQQDYAVLIIYAVAMENV